MNAEEYRSWWEVNAPVPYGLCWCGCGLETRPAPKTSNKAVKVKGEQVQFVYNASGARTASS